LALPASSCIQPAKNCIKPDVAQIITLEIIHFDEETFLNRISLENGGQAIYNGIEQTFASTVEGEEGWLH
jgi:hypothetical protein